MKKTDNASLARLLKLPEVAEILSLSLKTLRRRIDAGALTVIRDGRILRVHPNDVERYIASRRGL
jgi:excisionase family DNA binding protein